MSGLAAVSSPTGNEIGVSKMDGDNVSTLGRLLQAARERRQSAGREYMLALTASVVAGECRQTVEHDHRQFYLRGLDLMINEIQA